jgi:hypothetical protein
MNKLKKRDIISSIAMIGIIGLLVYLGSISLHQYEYICFFLILLGCSFMTILVAYIFRSK